MIPVAIEHGVIQRKHAVARDSIRRRDERGEAIVDLGAFGAGGTGEEMPQRERVFGAGLSEYDRELPRPRVGGRLECAEAWQGVAKGARAVSVHREGVSATQIDGGGGRRVHNEFCGRRPDGGVYGAKFEIDALAIRGGLYKANAGVRLELNLAEVILPDGGTGGGGLGGGLGGTWL